jgi:urea transporter
MSFAAFAPEQDFNEHPTNYFAIYISHHKQAVLSLKRHFTGVSEVVCEDNTEAGIAERFSCQAASDPNFLFSLLGAFLALSCIVSINSATVSRRSAADD